MTTRAFATLRYLLPVAVVLVLCGGFGNARPTRAEYEIPYVDGTSAEAAVEFRGIWSTNRGMKWGTKTYNNFEAYAVGVDPTNNNPDSNGVMFYYDGNTWKKVAQPMWQVTGHPVPTPTLNAISGQYNAGYGNATYIFAAGVKGQAWVMQYITTPGATLADCQNAPYNNSTTADLGYPWCNMFTKYNLPAAGETRNLYTVDSVQEYAKLTLLGGQTNGTEPLLLYGNQSSFRDTQNTPAARPISFDPAAVIPANQKWQDPQHENIVSIRYVDQTTAYLLTSTYTTTSGSYVDGTGAPLDRYSADARNCSTTGGAGPKPKFRLYRLRNLAVDHWDNARFITGGFQFLADMNDCGYDLTPAIQDSGSVGGSLPNAIWMAGYKGVYIYDERNPAAGIHFAQETDNLTTNAIHPYAVTSVRHVSGSGQNLLLNGSFENWSGSTPSNWTNLGASFGAHNYNQTCIPDAWLGSANDYDIRSNDIRNGIHSGDYYLEIWPGKAYSDANCTSTTFSGGRKVVPTASYTRLDLTTYEGEQFKVEGDYKVTFEVPSPTNDTAHPDPNATSMPQYAEGGVGIECGGVNDQYGALNDVNCSVKNRSLIRTYTNLGVGNADNHDGSTTNDPGNVDGWVHFSMIVSRQDLQIGTFYTSGSLAVTPRRMEMILRCEGSYGAHVRCDNLSVSEVANPPIPGHPQIYVAAGGVAVGSTRSELISNQDALTAGSTFAAEQQPTFVDPSSVANGTTKGAYQALSSVSVQHVFAAGALLKTADNTPSTEFPNGVSTLLSRTPSTLVGKIWVGTGGGSVGSSTQATAGSGYISVSCINTRDATTGETLCQQSPDSYGWSLDLGTTSGVTTGVLSGRAWYGKTILGSADDQESVDAGKCDNAPKYVNGSNPYNLNAFCDVANRRCYANSFLSSPRLHTSQSCTSDFDCYGRCHNDQGRICTADSDCKLSPTSATGPLPGYTTNTLTAFPADRLKCDIKSPLSCSSFGWLSLNPGDFADASIPAGWGPPGTKIGIKYNTLNSSHGLYNPAVSVSNRGGHELSGFARFITLATPGGFCSGDKSISCNSATPCPASMGSCLFADDHGTGWVHFRGGNVGVTPLTLKVQTSSTYTGSLLPAAGTPAQSRPYLNNCHDCYGGTLDSMSCAFCMDQSRASCVPADGTPVAPHNSCHYFCDQNPNVACVNNEDCPSGDACKPPGFCSGDMTTRCSQNSDCSVTTAGHTPGGYCQFGAVCQIIGSDGPLCTQYGVNYSLSSGTYYGYGWSEDFGWLDFRGTSRASSRFIQTQLGDVYANGSIGNSSIAQPSGVNNCNATFLIVAHGDIASNWCSAIASAGNLPSTISGKQAAAAPISLPDSTTYYQNALGRMDINGIKTVVKTTGAGLTLKTLNKYGSEVVTLTPTVTGSIGTELGTKLSDNSTAHVANTGILGGRVFSVDCSAAPNSTCILDQSLTINPSDSLTDHGSGAGILYVHGNLKITANLVYGAGTIDDLRKVASFVIIVDGTPGDTIMPGDLKIDDAVENLVGAYYASGTIYTTTSSVDSLLRPLEIRGLMIAGNYVFGRHFAGTSERPAPSELIVFDGRLQSNPMPGLVDFSRILPSSVTQP